MFELQGRTVEKMLLNLTPWFLLAALLVVFNAQVGKALPTVADVYNAESFGMIGKSGYPHFIMFYAPW